MSTTGASSDGPITAAEILRRRLGLVGTDSTADTRGRVWKPSDEKDDPRMRKNSSVSSSSSEDDDNKVVDLDEEIRRLEAALQQSDRDDDDDEEQSESSGVNDSRGTREGTRATSDEPVATEGILCLSTVRDDRIESLPAQYLPAKKKRIIKSVDKEDSGAVRKKSKKANDSAGTSDVAHKSGLERAVQEVLAGYQPRSSERLPFYCRVCAQQYDNEDSFFQHRQGDFHRTAVEMERKMSFCKLCRKQLTSPAQLQEHLQSRPHHERLVQLKKNHPTNRSGPNRTARGSQGRGRGPFR